jgi:chromosome segregation ATPase
LSTFQEQLDALRHLVKAREKAAGAGQEISEGLLLIYQAMADRLRDLEESLEDLSAYVETIDEDLTRLEGHLYNMEDEAEEEEPAYLDGHNHFRPES